MSGEDHKILRGIWRIIVVSTGFILAAVVTLIVLAWLGLAIIAQDTVQPSQDELGRLINMLTQFYDSTLFVMATAPLLTILPAVIVVVIGELGEIRSSLYYISAGGIAMAILPFMSAVAEQANANPLMPEPKLLGIFAVAGFAGGALYWLIAGRTA